jgi:hypothetical protein
MTERFWTPERKKHYYQLAKKEEHRRKYIREYMRRERAKGNIKHWREYKSEKKAI